MFLRTLAFSSEDSLASAFAKNESVAFRELKASMVFSPGRKSPASIFPAGQILVKLEINLTPSALSPHCDAGRAWLMLPSSGEGASWALMVLAERAFFLQLSSSETWPQIISTCFRNSQGGPSTGVLTFALVELKSKWHSCPSHGPHACRQLGRRCAPD